MTLPPQSMLDALSAQYAFKRELGRGGMGTVYLADDLKHGRPVAIKVLRPELTAPLGKDRFLREIAIAARLNNPHIVPLHDSGAVDGTLYYVMPYVEGETLRDRLNREGPLTMEEAVRYARGIAAALDHAHSHGVIHRDIKPANILLSGDEAVVADFGVARAVTEAAGRDLSTSGIAVGTPAYMSPEQASGDREIDGRSDLYALGCVLYEMVTGEPPFHGRNRVAIMAKHVHEPVPSVRTLRPDLPAALDSAIGRAMAKTPANRFASAAALTRALDSSQRHTLSERQQEWLRWLTAGAVVGTLALLIGLYPRLLHPGGATDPSVYMVAHLFNPGADSTRTALFLSEVRLAMTQVPDLRTVNAERSSDRTMRDGTPSDLEGWLSRASSLGVGTVVLISQFQIADSTRIVARKYGLPNGRVVATARPISLTSWTLTTIDSAAASIVEQLFQLEPGVIAMSHSNVTEAVQAFVAGTQARERWDFEKARDEYQRAVDLDSDFARARFWLAQVMAWRREPQEQWGAMARSAVSLRLVVPEEDILARALADMADHRYGDACALFQSMIDEDANDFRAWLGLAECRRLDHTVVRDLDSESGWSFRSDYAGVLEAYLRASELAPSFAFTFGPDPVTSLSRLFFADAGRIRTGYTEVDSLEFGAFPALVGRRLHFTPWPSSVIAKGEVDVSTLRDALDHNRQILGEVADKFVKAFPDNVTAMLAKAASLELQGRLVSVRREFSAVQWSARALAEATTREDELRAAVVHVRLLVKTGDYEQARKIAISTLDQWESDTPGMAGDAAALAALVGWPDRAAWFAGADASSRLSERGFSDTPLDVLTDTDRLAVYAALQAPADSISRIARRLNTIPSAELSRLPDLVTCGMIANAISAAFPVLHQSVSDSTCWQGAERFEMQYWLQAGRPRRVFELMDRLDSLRAFIPAADQSIDAVYQEAWIVAEAGDTARAKRHLDAWLDQLQAARPWFTRNPVQAAALVRAFVWRADLAAAEGDAGTAGRWARAAATLWGRTDTPELGALVSRMNQIARSAQQ